MPEFTEYITRKIEGVTGNVFEEVMRDDVKNAKHFLIMRNEFIGILNKYRELQKNKKEDLGKLL